MRIERVIISGLIKLERYRIKVLPYLKKEYFSDRLESAIFLSVSNYIKSYSNPPSKDDVKLDISNNAVGITDDDMEQLNDLVDEVWEIKTNSEEWITEETEKFCQDKSLFNAIKTSIDIVDDPRKNRNSILSVLKDALATGFNKDLGQDYIEDAEERFVRYANRDKEKIPFDLDLLNNVTNGGIPANKGTLNVFMAGTNVGKTLFLIHHAASCLSMGYNVAYFSMEMDEDELSKRIDASKLNIDINDLTDTPTQVLKDRFQKVCSSSWGKLKLKQFPTGQASVTDFEAYLNELKIQENFKPDIVYVDYIGITGSANLPQSAKQNSYLYFKSVAEELRAFGVENSFPVMTATQTNRDGYAHADPDMDKGSDSFGIFMTADFGGAILTNDELENLSQYLFKQLKNRYNQKMKNKRFLIGYDLTRMRLFDVTQGAQTSGLPNNGGGQTQSQPDTIQLNKKKRSNTLDFGKIKI